MINILGFVGYSENMVLFSANKVQVRKKHINIASVIVLMDHHKPRSQPDPCQ